MKKMLLVVALLTVVGVEAALIGGNPKTWTPKQLGTAQEYNTTKNIQVKNARQAAQTKNARQAAQTKNTRQAAKNARQAAKNARQSVAGAQTRKKPKNVKLDTAAVKY